MRRAPESRSLFEDADDALLDAMNRLGDYVPLSVYDEVLKPLEQAVATLIKQRDDAYRHGQWSAT